MEMKKRVLTGALCGALLVGTVVPTLAATEHYNNGASVGGSAEWTAWTQDWESVATDYTKVSLTPGADETELNFAWYSKDDGKAATPVVHFGTDRNNLKTFTGKAADVDTVVVNGEIVVEGRRIEGVDLSNLCFQVQHTAEDIARRTAAAKK